MTWDEMKSEVERNGNVYTFTMEALRDAHGSGRLGVHVRTEISSALAGIGLGHVPQDLPNFQHEQVRLYKRGTQIGDLIDVVLSPGQSNDEKLRAQSSTEQVDNAALVQKIRELVGE